MGTQEDSKIYRILCSGDSLEFEDEITRKLQSLDEEDTPGTRIKFVNSFVKKGDNKSWKEYEVMIEIDKFKNTSDYMELAFKNISKIFRSISFLDTISSIGIQEFSGSYSDYYYLLIYIIKE